MSHSKANRIVVSSVQFACALLTATHAGIKRFRAHAVEQAEIIGEILDAWTLILLDDDDDPPPTAPAPSMTPTEPQPTDPGTWRRIEDHMNNESAKAAQRNRDNQTEAEMHTITGLFPEAARYALRGVPFTYWANAI